MQVGNPVAYNCLLCPQHNTYTQLLGFQAVLLAAHYSAVLPGDASSLAISCSSLVSFSTLLIATLLFIGAHTVVRLLQLAAREN